MRHFQRRHPQWVTRIESTDVLFGRGYAINMHPGNTVYRKFIKKRKAEYNGIKTRRIKSKIAQEVVDAFRAAHKAGPLPRFLRKPTASEVTISRVPKDAWCIVDEERILEKTKQGLRCDPLPSAKKNRQGDARDTASDTHSHSTPTTQANNAEKVVAPPKVPCRPTFAHLGPLDASVLSVAESLVDLHRSPQRKKRVKTRVESRTRVESESPSPARTNSQHGLTSTLQFAGRAKGPPSSTMSDWSSERRLPPPTRTDSQRIISNLQLAGRATVPPPSNTAIDRISVQRLPSRRTDLQRIISTLQLAGLAKVVPPSSRPAIDWIAEQERHYMMKLTNKTLGNKSPPFF